MNKIAEHRKKQNLTQKQLAEKLNVTEQYIQLWEYGKRKPNGKNIVQLAEIFDTSPKNLIESKTD